MAFLEKVSIRIGNQYLTWTQMMAAPQPPSPAPYIPSPFTWCEAQSGAALQVAVEGVLSRLG